MIGVTERAKQELKKMLLADADDPLAGLRLTATDQDKLGLSIDVETPGDTVVEHEGSKVLMVEQQLSDQLQGFTIDVEDTRQGAKLVIFADS